MRLIQKIFLTFTVTTYFFVGSVYAAGPTPTIPVEIRPTCGYAGIEGAEACCPQLPLSDGLHDSIQILQLIPLFGGLTTGLVDTLVSVVKHQPLYQQIDKKCRLGDPKIDPNTGREASPCMCANVEPTPFPTPVTTGFPKLLELCQHYENAIERIGCENCANTGGILTGVGCVPTNYSKFVSEFLFRMGIGFGGLFSLGCIIFAAIRIQTSGGDAEKIGAAQEQIKACMLGLLLVMFSILLLKIIGVNILGIPGFI